MKNIILSILSICAFFVQINTADALTRCNDVLDPPNLGQTGQQRFNGGRMEYCNGTDWILLGVDQRSQRNLGICPIAGQEFYANSRIEYCAGDNNQYSADCGALTNVVCDAPGTQRYNSASSVMQICNGTKWVNLGNVSTLPCCPMGFVPVPKDAYSGTTKDFCVSKYHMKATTNAGTPVANGIGLGQHNLHYPESRAASTPWSGLTFARAYNECASLGSAFPKLENPFHLITNPEWMTIAKNIELHNQNWNTGIVGSGHVATGHSDGDPNSYLAANTNDALSCDGTNNNDCLSNLSSYQKRTFTLSNGSVIWDMAGNINSWVSADPDGNSISYTKSTCDYSDNICRQEINDAYNLADLDPFAKYQDINLFLYPVGIPAVTNNFRAFFPYNISLGMYLGALDQYGFGIISWNYGAGIENNIVMFRGGWYGEPRSSHPPDTFPRPNNEPARKFSSTQNDRPQGIYSAWLTNKNNESLINVGFRCVYTPPD